ncbi:hypothetical protein Esi_0000_0580 [Ectocarpus siliculosus]|uniref:Uncharacterized protein n=1 Tax=Ectocarpus siliculosus TaxID=2880 RepID=D8LBQ1_ECTSI|nr:hypothetical protein Esi_0000_0580 [Ectocarpus siliculosus]|eukprot:CBN76760.1 hypothetical protein Esi_0000_0580 [Ectocarpus siliculosus]
METADEEEEEEEARLATARCAVFALVGALSSPRILTPPADAHPTGLVEPDAAAADCRDGGTGAVGGGATTATVSWGLLAADCSSPVQTDSAAFCTDLSSTSPCTDDGFVASLGWRSIFLFLAIVSELSTKPEELCCTRALRLLRWLFRRPTPGGITGYPPGLQRSTFRAINPTGAPMAGTQSAFRVTNPTGAPTGTESATAGVHNSDAAPRRSGGITGYPPGSQRSTFRAINPTGAPMAGTESAFRVTNPAGAPTGTESATAGVHNSDSAP